MKITLTKSPPPLGTTELRVRFAWLPIVIELGDRSTKLLWLEKYIEERCFGYSGWTVIDRYPRCV